MDELIGYKVVRYNNRYKCYQSATYSGCVTYYDIDKTTVPYRGNGPLAVFDTIENARKFVSDRILIDPDHVNLHILKSEYRKSNKSNLSYYDPHLHCAGNIYIEMCPEGTILAEYVKLLDIVE